MIKGSLDYISGGLSIIIDIINIIINIIIAVVIIVTLTYVNIKMT